MLRYYKMESINIYIISYAINAIINRNARTSVVESSEFEFNFGSFHLNSKLRHLSYLDNAPVKLSPKENLLLKMLILYKNDLMPRELALTKIWRDDNYFTSRSMDVYIAKLRKYLKNDETVEIINIHGEGFRLVTN